MSFNSKHTGNTINTGNYEEFFILYMDNELSKEQVKMVDEFLLAHPGLQAEFGILMKTKLPAEDFSFNKEDLMAENMKLTSVDEELLLYIDSELPAGRITIVEQKFTAGKNLRAEYELLLQTKLDASEEIPYPNKIELYRKEERIIAIRPWIRIAAAAIVIAVMSVFYFRNSSSSVHVDTPVGSTKDNPLPKTDPQVIIAPKQPQEIVVTNNQIKNKNIRQRNQEKNSKADHSKNAQQENKILNNALNQNSVAGNDTPDKPFTQRSHSIDTRVITTSPVASIDSPDIKILNNKNVTSVIPVRNNSIASSEPKEDTKGSVRGLLRKATRMIAKRTGVDATNDGNELLLGAVAIRLK